MVTSSTMTSLYGVLLLLLDSLLTAAFWTVLLVLGGSGCGAVDQWSLAGLKCVTLVLVACALADGRRRAVLCRLAALLCLLPPLLDFLSPDLTPDPGTWLLGAACSAFSCVVWEAGLSGGQSGQKKEDLDAGRLLARVLQHVRVDFLFLSSAFVFLILAVGCDTVIPLYQGKVMDILTGPQLDSDFLSTVALLVFFSLGSCVLTGLRAGVFMCSHARLNKRLKLLLFGTLLRQEVHFFQDNNAGDLSSRLHSDVNKMGLTVALNANAVLRSTVKTALMLALMWRLSWRLTALACIEIPLMAALQKRHIACTKELTERKQDCLAAVEALAGQSLGGIRTVRSFNGERDETRRHREALHELRGVRRQAAVYNAVFVLVRRLGSLAIKTAMLLHARTLIAGGHLSIGSLLSFLLFRKPMSHNLKEILFCCGDTLSTVGVISKVFSYLDRTPPGREEGPLAPQRLRGSLVFQDVTFRYPSRAQDQPALKALSMELQAGKVTALVGPSGSGKTTCLSLLKRFYEPECGRILLDGEPLQHYRRRYLHEKVVLVEQSPVLLCGSVRSNVEYGMTCDPRQVREVAIKVGACDLLDSDADVGEGGRRLSEGEKQRVAVVRALVRDPPVILLDEATSQLDGQAQEAVLREVLRGGRTVLMVAHRLSSAERADRIVFMEDGAVVEEGTHLQLMARRGRYHRLREELFSDLLPVQDS
ncbi:antigen peptide transporter 2-like [Entelurus aequoreus]|uniref:antigen peptide transporter 2-like n=1 Tax=Entelurus aequoreus TaxID=161455 RepID=UPI002B1E49A1|nr:antigen peptide transporter 2-like [Entelurus aequoreus]